MFTACPPPGSRGCRAIERADTTTLSVSQQRLLPGVAAADDALAWRRSGSQRPTPAAITGPHHTAGYRAASLFLTIHAPCGAWCVCSRVLLHVVRRAAMDLLVRWQALPEAILP